MTIPERVASLFSRKAAPPAKAAKKDAAIGTAVKGAFKTGKQSSDFDATYLSGHAFLPRRAYDVSAAEYLSQGGNLSYVQIMALLPDLDPDLSMALWNVTRLVQSDFRVSAFKPGKKQVADEAAQELLEEFQKRVNKQYGGINNLIGMLAQTGYLQGAMAAEAVFDPATLKVTDVALVNPATIHFRQDGDTGTVEAYQYQQKPHEGAVTADANYVRMNPGTFWYVPIDPSPGDRYGRSPATAAIADIFFMLKVMYDLRKVVHNQGWPRIDVSVMTDIIKAMAPDSVQEDPKLIAEFISARIAEIVSAYNDLKPDDTFIHSDGVQIGMVGLPGNGGGTLDPTALLLAIERRIIRGLKQLPILMGSNEGTTESHGTVQYVITARSIEAFQKPIEDILEGVYELFLRMEGIQATVEVEFERLRATDRKADAEAEALEIANESAKRDEGWITNDDASLKITGSTAVGEPKPDPVPVIAADPNAPAPGTDPTPADPVPPADPGAKNIRSGGNRVLTLAGQRRKFEAIKTKARSAIRQGFKGIEEAFDAEAMVSDLAERFPISPENTLLAAKNLRAIERAEKAGKRALDVNSPVYAEAVRVIGKFFAGEEATRILDEMTDAGAELMLAAYENYGQQVLLRLAEKDPAFAYAAFRLDDYGQKRLIEERAAFFPRSAFETAQGDLAKTVMRGYRDAKTVDEIARDLKDKFAELESSRAELIANMELNWATSQGTLTTMKKNGVLEKRWVTVNDSRVRPDHRENQEEGAIPVDAGFRGTGDTAPPAGFNCRCAVIEEVDGDWKAPGDIWTGGSI